MYNKVELCGVNTAELPILSEQEKRDLLTRARAGDKAARQSMIEGNLRLVLSVVQRFSQRGENMDDLFQVGCIGLIKAIDNFDPAQQVRFSTYGVPMIIGEIRRFLRDNNALRVSRSLRDTAYRAMQSREELEKQLGREPTVDEIAQKTGLSRREVSAALESVVEPLSLEEPVYADGGDAVPIKMASLRYAFCGCCLCIQNANCYIIGAYGTSPGWPRRPAGGARLCSGPAPSAPAGTAPGLPSAAAPTRLCVRWTCCSRRPAPPPARWPHAPRCTLPAAAPAVPDHLS